MSQAVRLLSTTDIQRSTSIAMAIQAVERAFGWIGTDQVAMPAKVYLQPPGIDGDFRAMPAAIPGAAGVKWVNSHPNNPTRHKLPTVMAVYLLSNPETAQPLAILDGTYLTALRTGAAAAVASKYLARPDAQSLGLIGCGIQALHILQSHREILPNLEVIVADLNPVTAQRFADEHRGVVGTAADAARCDIVCTSTPSRSPVVDDNWLHSGCHINAMGADAPGKQEFSASTLKRAQVFVDDLEQASESGEINVPLHRGELCLADINGSLAEVVRREKQREHHQSITLFDSTGLALQDLALAHVIYQQALQNDMGTEFQLI